MLLQPLFAHCCARSLFASLISVLDSAAVVCRYAGAWLPAYSKCNKVFLGQILTGARNCLAKRDVPRLSVPKWPELGLPAVWPKVAGDEVLMSYFPKEVAEDGHFPDRDHFWGVLQTIRSEFAQTLVQEAQHLRAQT